MLHSFPLPVIIPLIPHTDLSLAAGTAGQLVFYNTKGLTQYHTTAKTKAGFTLVSTVTMRYI